jgi:DNA-binding response OmpR family regulator
MTILMLGRHLELGYYRAEFLKSHGFQVIFPENKAAAISAIETGDFDAIIVSYTLSAETTKELVNLIKQTSPDCPIVAITQQPWDEDGFPRDETILDRSGPQGLIDALIRIEKRKQEQSQIRRVK